MKFKLAFVLFSFVFVQFGFAQVTETSAAMNLGVNDALVLTLKSTDAKMAEGLWDKFMKQYKAKTKAVKKSDELFSDDAEIEAISTNTIDVYALFKQVGADAQVVVWYNLGGAYLSSKAHPDRFPAAKAMLMNFSKEVEKETVQVKLKDEEAALKDLQKVLEDQQKTQSKEEEKIEDYKKKIAEAEAAIQESIRAQKAQQEVIDTQRKKIEETKAYLKKIGGKK
ncbi:MAG: hypothetical protein KDC44_18815 [Phaeodactylibacter sp.]|nr:hypothetical protein [Phaeodactylibacter sp.]